MNFRTTEISRVDTDSLHLFAEIPVSPSYKSPVAGPDGKFLDVYARTRARCAGNRKLAFLGVLGPLLKISRRHTQIERFLGFSDEKTTEEGHRLAFSLGLTRSLLIVVNFWRITCPRRLACS
jgi:hypothetical protein